MIQYLQGTMLISCVLHMFLSVFLLMEDSKQLRLSRILKDKKHVLR